ncbi:MAG TPA: hypothetical protein VFF69_08780 [Phycisphaerales bacterium]|nr:hypothetical protein [Phycisphaerales bacterium]
MVHSISRWLAVAVAVVAAAAPAAVAQDAGDIVRHAVAAMHRAVHNTQHDVAEATTRGVAAINHLDDNGATDDELIAAARHASRIVGAEAHQGARTVGLIAGRAVEALQDIGADRRFFVVVHDARDQSHEAIRQAAQRGHAALAAALRDALND